MANSLLVQPDESYDLEHERLQGAYGLLQGAFDASFYASEYPDISTEIDPLLHYCLVGWREGRNPSPFFDTTSYLLDHRDIARAQMNPYFHYLYHGSQEGRAVHPSASPSVRSRLLLGRSITEWVEILTPYVDVAFYTQQLPPRALGDADPVAHFAYRGWREGLSPAAGTDIAVLRERYPRCDTLLVNPLLVEIEARAGRFERPKRVIRVVPGRSNVLEFCAEAPQPVAPEAEPAQSEPTAPSDAPSPEDAEAVAVVRRGMSEEYYRACYPDIAAADVDPAWHYFYAGWREGRDPHPDFETEYYLKANEDIEQAGINPLWHYLVAGKHEGRLAKRPGGYRRRIIDAAQEPVLRTKDYQITEEPVTPAALRKRLKAALKHAKAGLAVSISHDCYARVVGGTQIFIADEQQRFERAGFGYLHLSPVRPQLKLASHDADFKVRLVLNGTVVGTILLKEVQTLLRTLRPQIQGTVHLVVHSALGMNADDLCDLWKIVKPSRSFYWLHDYSSLCEGFNLLRNDVQFCGAPAVESMSCRVCVYGAGRRQHLAEMEKVFSKCHFEVLAPSNFTLNLWRESTALPHESASAHPHWTLNAGPRIKNTRRTRDKVSVGFVGYPSPAKGWPIFAELAAREDLQQNFDFYQFAAGGTSGALNVKFVKTEVMASDREATVKLLREHKIDVVAMLSPWPETFSFVAHEAMVAGCLVVCLADSGNVADLVRSTGQGMVFESPEAATTFFTEGDVDAWVSSFKQKMTDYEAVPTGTTATVAGVASKSV